jgi:hypothetical protein
MTWYRQRKRDKSKRVKGRERAKLRNRKNNVGRDLGAMGDSEEPRIKKETHKYKKK